MLPMDVDLTGDMYFHPCIILKFPQEGEFTFVRSFSLFL